MDYRVKKRVQIEFSISPQSKLVVFPCLIMWIASSVYLFQYRGSCSSTLAASQAWTAIPLFLSPLLTAALCSVKCFCTLRFLLVSPNYPSYTTSFSSSLAFFTLIRVLRRVPYDLNTTPSPPSLLHVLWSEA